MYKEVDTKYCSSISMKFILNISDEVRPSIYTFTPSFFSFSMSKSQIANNANDDPSGISKKGTNLKNLKTYPNQINGKLNIDFTILKN